MFWGEAGGFVTENEGVRGIEFGLGKALFGVGGEGVVGVVWMSLEIMIEGGVLGDVLVENGSHGGTDDFGVVVVGGGLDDGDVVIAES